MINVTTQEELDRVLREEREARAVLVGDAGFVVRESAHVEARGSAHVEARGSAHVEARGSAHVEAWGSAHVEARESAHVEAWESAHVVASRFVAIHQHSATATLSGGVVIDVRRPTTPAEWCDFYGVGVKDGIAVVYKAVHDDYRSRRGHRYEPGTTVEAPDWDGGREECGGGLHFSPHPAMALGFDSRATRFLACPVALADMRAPRADDSSPAKIKARRVCAPMWEVDRHGETIPPPPPTSR